MRRPSATSTFAYSFGPGPLTPAVKAIILANVAMFLAEFVIQRTAGISLNDVFGLRPVAVLQGFQVWLLVSYMFLHGGVFHILFNMLALWMFGVELERMWGTRYFTKFYFVTGIGAGVVHILASLTPFGASAYVLPTVGASGAIYGILLAYAMYFPNRPILMYFFFPIPAKYFVLIIGTISFLAATDGAGSGVAHTAHLGGLLVGYLYLKKGPRVHLMSEIKYRYLKWRINRMRRRFDVYSGGRANDVDRRVH
jgi:membrane associated rhomboid family serine protease